MLARRDHSALEIRQKLRTKGFTPEDIQTIILEVSQSGYLSESRFTEHYIRWRRGKGFGPERIMLELQTRGITAEMIAEQIDITDNAWFNEARHVWQKHFRGKMPQDFKDKAKQMRFLQYRGFTREQIAKVFGSEPELD